MNPWPGGVSDGLTLPCRRCGVVPRFDYSVDGDFWRAVVPADWRLDVVCLPCLDEMAHAEGRDVAPALRSVQFTGIGKTILLGPAYTHYYDPRAGSIQPDSRLRELRAALEAQSSSEEVSRMEPFPLVPIPPHEVEREVKAYNEKFFEHEDLDGMEPYDWREVATLDAAFAGGFLPESDMSEAAAWYNFKKLRATGATDTAHPEFAAFCSWALEILNGPSTPEPDPWPVYDAEVYQAERLRRASE